MTIASGIVYGYGPQGLDESTSFMNLGYWQFNPPDLNEASRHLVRLMGNTAELGPNMDVLDCGFGYGEQDIQFLQEFQPRKITGVNVTYRQVEVARKRAAELGLTDRIDYRYGSATNLDFPAGSFDRVLALESAMHFPTREDFFRQAYRVLKPGGKIVLADMPLRDDYRPEPLHFAMQYAQRIYFSTPESNAYNVCIYRGKLQAAGFEDVEIVSIRDHVIDPFNWYTSTRTVERLAAQMPGLDPSSRGQLETGLFEYQSAFSQTYDYVLATGVKKG